MYYTLISEHHVGCTAIADIYRPFFTSVAFIFSIYPPPFSDVTDLPPGKTIWTNLDSKSRRAIIFFFKKLYIQLHVPIFYFLSTCRYIIFLIFRLPILTCLFNIPFVLTSSVHFVHPFQSLILSVFRSFVLQGSLPFVYTALGNFARWLSSCYLSSPSLVPPYTPTFVYKDYCKSSLSRVHCYINSYSSPFFSDISLPCYTSRLRFIMNSPVRTFIVHHMNNPITCVVLALPFSSSSNTFVPFPAHSVIPSYFSSTSFIQ